MQAIPGGAQDDDFIGRTTTTTAGGSVKQESEDYSFLTKEYCETHFPWLNGHKKKPNKEMSVFELEDLVARRMELLGYIDAKMNAPTGKSRNDIIAMIAQECTTETLKALGRMNTFTKKRDSTNHFKQQYASRGPSAIMYDPETEVISHRLCRYAFCQDDKWRTWFKRNEEILFRARLQKLQEVIGANRMQAVLSAAEIPIEPYPTYPRDPASRTEGEQRLATQTEKIMNWMRRTPKFVLKEDGTTGKANNDNLNIDRLCLIPMQYAVNLVRERRAVCVSGKAVLDSEDLTGICVDLYQANLSRELLSCNTTRHGQAGDEDTQDEREAVWAMLDAFMNYIIINPQDKVESTNLGDLTPAGIPHASNNHMPLCMRGCEQTVDKKGHLKHHGRWQFGLFLKSIGLTMDDSISYFAEKMTLKGGGSREVFAKSSYGYGIRHAYGQEGKRTSYTGMNCGSIIKSAPGSDAYDCHGCPFRFSGEGDLRGLLAQERPNPVTGKVAKLMQSDIEDIVQDSKNSHYTRACYKYYAATHKGAARDELFNSPYEYYVASRTCEEERAAKEKKEGGEDDQSPLPQRRGGSVKRERNSNAREDNIPPKGK